MVYNNMIRTAKLTWDKPKDNYKFDWKDEIYWEYKTNTFVDNIQHYQRQGHEIILGTDTTKPLFDIDIGGIEPDKSVINKKRKEVISALTTELKLFRTKIFALFNTTITWGFADASGYKDKGDKKEGFISLRCGINNIKLNWLNCKILAKDLFKNIISSYGTQSIDTSIYSNGGQLLRMPYQFKPADQYKRYFKPLDAEPNLFIAQIFDADWVSIDDFIEGLKNPLQPTLSTPTPANALINPKTITKDSVRVSEIKRLFNCLNPDCCREEWSQIRWALSNIEGILNFKPLYEEWSKKSNKYSQEFCGDTNYSQTQIDLWGVEKNKYAYNYGTLHFLAKEHNPTKYQEELIVRCDNPYGLAPAIHTGNFNRQGLLPNQIANMICEYIKRREDRSFVYDGKEWFAFKNGKWQATGELFIYSFINDRFCPLLSSQSIAMLTYLHEAEDLSEEVKKELVNYPKIASATKSYLGDPAHKDKVIKELRAIYFIPKFHQEILDCNRWLIGFNNGVFDLKTFKFRPALEEDYVSKSVGYDFDPNSNTEENMNNIDQFFNNMFVGYGDNKQDEEEKKIYIKSWLAWSCIGAMPDGFNPPFIALTGTGSNGKSKIVEFMGKVLGEHEGGYSGNFNEKTFTGDDSGGGEEHQTQLYNNMKRRFCFFTEPKSHSSKGQLIHLNANKIKSYTSDLQSCRPAYGNKDNFIEFKVQFNLWATLNTMPRIDDKTNGTRRRIKEVVMKSQFLEQTDYDLAIQNNTIMPHHFPMDSDLENNIEFWGNSCAGFHYLIRHLKLVQQDKDKYLTAPNCVKVDTQDLFDGHDFFGAYVRTFICKGEEWEVVRLQDLIDWCKGKTDKPEEDKKVYQGVMSASTKEIGTGEGIKQSIKIAVETNFGIKLTARYSKYKKDQYAEGLRSVFVGVKWKYGSFHFLQNAKNKKCGRSTIINWDTSPIKEWRKKEGIISSTNNLLTNNWLDSDSEEEEELTPECLKEKQQEERDNYEGVCCMGLARWLLITYTEPNTHNKKYIDFNIINPMDSDIDGKRINSAYCIGCGGDLFDKPCFIHKQIVRINTSPTDKHPKAEDYKTQNPYVRFNKLPYYKDWGIDLRYTNINKPCPQNNSQRLTDFDNFKYYVKHNNKYEEKRRKRV